MISVSFLSGWTEQDNNSQDNEGDIQTDSNNQTDNDDETKDVDDKEVKNSSKVLLDWYYYVEINEYSIPIHYVTCNITNINDKTLNEVEVKCTMYETDTDRVAYTTTDSFNNNVAPGGICHLYFKRYNQDVIEQDEAYQKSVFPDLFSNVEASRDISLGFNL